MYVHCQWFFQYLKGENQFGPLQGIIFHQPTTVDKHTKISSEEISDGREYSLLFLYVKVVVSCKVVGLYGARRRLTNWQDTLF